MVQCQHCTWHGTSVCWTQTQAGINLHFNTCVQIHIHMDVYVCISIKIFIQGKDLPMSIILSHFLCSLCFRRCILFLRCLENTHLSFILRVIILQSNQLLPFSSQSLNEKQGLSFPMWRGKFNVAFWAPADIRVSLDCLSMWNIRKPDPKFSSHHLFSSKLY